MFKRSTTAYGQTDAPQTRYQKAAQVWDDRIGAARVQARNWRFMAFGCLLLAGGLGAGVVWQLGRSHITPYVVEVDAMGEVRAVGPAVEPYTPRDEIIAYQLSRFVENIRSLSIDPVIVRNNWLEAYDYATDQASLTLNDYARENDPFGVIGDRTVSVNVTSVVRSTDKTFEVRWREDVYQNGDFVRADNFTGSFTIVLQPPRDTATLRKNPLGLYVHALNWSEDFVSGERQ